MTLFLISCYLSKFLKENLHFSLRRNYKVTLKSSVTYITSKPSF